MTRETFDEVGVNSAQSKNAVQVHTPTPISPPDTRTPPTATHQRHQPNDTEARYSESRSGVIDPDILSNALKRFEDTGRNREYTPGGSPSKKRQRRNTDRLGKINNVY